MSFNGAGPLIYGLFQINLEKFEETCNSLKKKSQVNDIA